MTSQISPQLRSRIHSLLLTAGLCALVSLSAPAAMAQSPLDTLDGIFYDLGGDDESQVRAVAAAQAADSDGPNYKSVAVEQQTFFGMFTPTAATTQLAIFSDDGCDIYIDGTKVHARLNQGQALPNLSQSFYLVNPPSSWVPGQSYHIRVDYSNTFYQGLQDIDGATLFAFNGGGSILPTPSTWNPGPAPAFDPSTPYTITVNGSPADVQSLEVVAGDVIEITVHGTDLDELTQPYSSPQLVPDDLHVLLTISDQNGQLGSQRIEGTTITWTAPELPDGATTQQITLTLQLDDDTTTNPGNPTDNHPGNRNDGPGEQKVIQLALFAELWEFEKYDAMFFFYQEADASQNMAEGGTSPPTGARVLLGQILDLLIQVRDIDRRRVRGGQWEDFSPTKYTPVEHTAKIELTNAMFGDGKTVKSVGLVGEGGESDLTGHFVTNDSIVIVVDKMWDGKSKVKVKITVTDEQLVPANISLAKKESRTEEELRRDMQDEELVTTLEWSLAPNPQETPEAYPLTQTGGIIAKIDNKENWDETKQLHLAKGGRLVTSAINTWQNTTRTLLFYKYGPDRNGDAEGPNYEGLTVNEVIGPKTMQSEIKDEWVSRKMKEKYPGKTVNEIIEKELGNDRALTFSINSDDMTSDSYQLPMAELVIRRILSDNNSLEIGSLHADVIKAPVTVLMLQEYQCPPLKVIGVKFLGSQLNYVNGRWIPHQIVIDRSAI
ncbi:MAG: hypothetical protein R3C01_01380 [Planctomycetaceae bacterium]